MAVVVLLGGAHVSGKHTAERLLREEIKKRELSKVVSIDMNDYKVQGEPNTPSMYDFEAVKLAIDKLDDTTIVLVVGLYALFDSRLRQMSHISVYIESDPDTRLIRWIRRDIDSSSLHNILQAYVGSARQEANDYIYPTKAYADVIMPRGPEKSSISLVVDGIEPLLEHIKPVTHIKNVLRPAAEKFDNEKGKYFELS